MNSSIGVPGKDGIYFSVSTLMVDDGRSLKAPPIDKFGYYCGVPMAVLGIVSRNNTRYIQKPFADQIKGPSTFSKRIEEGVAAGEHGHPFIPNINSPEGIARLAHIEPTREAIHMRRVDVRHIEDLGIDVVTGDIKPSGPYGRYFKESMDDPSRNTAFSLRAFSRPKYDHRTRITDKYMLSLVTFDNNVVGSGFKESTKRYIVGSQEALRAEKNDDIICTVNDVIDARVNPDDLIALRSMSIESFTDTEFNEIVKVKRIIMASVEIGFVSGDNMIIDNEGHRKNIFGTFMQVKGRD